MNRPTGEGFIAALVDSYTTPWHRPFLEKNSRKDAGPVAPKALIRTVNTRTGCSSEPSRSAEAATPHCF
jgi:hypothetical protein